MKRLTFKNEKNDPFYGKAYITCNVEDCIVFDCEANAPCEKMKGVIDRLFDLEEILGDEYDLDRLLELVEVDKAGLIGKCKVRCLKCGCVLDLMDLEGP